MTEIGVLPTVKKAFIRLTRPAKATIRYNNIQKSLLNSINMKFSTRIGNFMDSQGLKSIYYLYFGQHDLPKNNNHAIYYTLKQIASLTRLTVKQV